VIDVKIAEIVTVPITCHGRARRGIVKITTDEGFVGYGEVGETAAEALGSIMTDRWRPLLVGKNPLDTERLLRALWASSLFAGRGGGALLSALSGVDFALVDLKGKILGIPGYQVVGGGFRRRIRIYQDTAGGPDAATYARNAVEAQRNGFDAIKFDLDVGVGEPRGQHGYDPYNETVTTQELALMVAKVAAIREAIGYEMDLAIDLHSRYNTVSGIRIARALEPYRLMWLEEPVPPENVEAMREVKLATSTPICCGENLYSKWGFRDLLERQAADIIMPDIAQVGGIVEGKRIADLADLYYVPVAPHNNCGPLATIAQAHLCAAIPNFHILEWHGARIPEWDKIVLWDGPVIDRGGINLPDKPGLGYELNEREILRRDPDAGALFT
jgi:galactonate dehydratase